jgi:hypothetical protein
LKRHWAAVKIIPFLNQDGNEEESEAVTRQYNALNGWSKTV